MSRTVMWTYGRAKISITDTNTGVSAYWKHGRSIVQHNLTVLPLPGRRSTWLLYAFRKYRR